MEKRTEKTLEIRARAEPAELTELQAIELSLSGSEKLDRLPRKKDGDLANRFSNYVDVLTFDPYLKNRLHLNALDGRAYIDKTFWDLARHPVRKEDRGKIREYLSRVYGLETKQSVEDAMYVVASKNKYHPVLDCLASLPAWDGVPRVRKLFPKYLGAVENDYTEAVTRLLFFGAIERVRTPGCKFDYCVVLADCKQGTGKSTLCRFLALQDTWFTDELRNLDDAEKAFETIRGKWVVELGEMVATRRAKEVESIKQYISCQSDVYRQKYEVHAEDYPRQAIFIGTTNKPQFLPEDRTGNRRFIPLICDYRRAEFHPLDNEAETREYIRQCYSEMLAYIKDHGASLVLDARFTAEADTIREDASPDDTRVGMIESWLEHTTEDYVCTRLIADKVFLEGGNTKEIALRDIGEIMTLKITGWEKVGFHRFSGELKKYGTQRAWKRVTESDTNFVAVGDGSDDNIPFD